MNVPIKGSPLVGEKRILVVDDSADICKLLTDYILGPAGYKVVTAGDGPQGLKLAREWRPDLIILDYEMPFCTGLEVLAALRQDGVRIPTILVTAQGSEALAVRAMRAGASDYLTKPFTAEEILEAVNRVWQAQFPAPSEPGDAGSELQALQAARASELGPREISAFHKIARSLTAQLNLEQVLNHVVEAAVTLTQAEEGSLLLIDAESGELYMRAAKNFDEDMARNFRIKVSDSLAGEVIRSRMPMTLSAASAHKIVTAYMVKDLIYAPLIMDDRAIGVLGVDNRIENRAFDQHHVRLLTALADYAVIAIRNASLYAQSQHERDTLETILRKTEDVVIITDPEGKVILLNPTARAAFGVNGNNVVGRPLHEVISHDSVLEMFSREGGVGHSLTGEVALENGDTLHAQVTIIDGVGRVAVMQDISHLKELDRVKSEFVSTVSHDLRSPLTAILGYVELLGRAGELNDTQRQFVDRIVYSVQSITALISDLLELGRIEAGFEAGLEPTPIHVIMRYAFEAKRSDLEARRHHLTMDLPGHLPEVLGNPLRLKQLFVNLLDNAIKYTPEGGQIGLRAHAQGDLVIAQVSDNGIGIPAQEQHRIFEKFYRARNVAQTTTGTGLGLSLVKTIVERHSGRVWVESREGEGSTFTVMLPACPTTRTPDHDVVEAVSAPRL